jgi:hypothetical protein
MTTVIENIRAGKYHHKIDFSAPCDAKKMLKTELNNIARIIEDLSLRDIKIPPELMEDASRKLTMYDAAKRRIDEYYEEGSNLHLMFQRDLAEENGMRGHPKEFLLFSKAWERGHSAGFEEVAIVYMDLVELAK